MKKIITALLIASLLIVSSAGNAGALGDADKAYKSSNYAKAIKLYKSPALKGNPNAQFALGVMYENGQGVAQDYAEAFKWYRLAAEQGTAEEQAKDRWYGYAKGPNIVNAQTNIGYMYANGLGVTKDYTEAVRWYRLAAEQGDAKAEVLLARMYDDGNRIKQDYVEAVKWWRMAAEQGVAIAQQNLGYMYEDGHGVTQDYVLAHMWYNLAAMSNTTLAGKRRAQISKSMTTDQIALAQKLARECVARKYKGC